MRTIWKFRFEITDWQKVEMPSGAQVLHAGLDNFGSPCLWAIVDPSAPISPVEVRVIGTGNPMPEEHLHHVGTFNVSPFIWHVFVAIELKT